MGCSPDTGWQACAGLAWDCRPSEQALRYIRLGVNIFAHLAQNSLTTSVGSGTLSSVLAPSKRHSYRPGMKEVMPMSDKRSGIAAKVTK